MKNNIKKLRSEKAISQKQLAEYLNVSRQTINAIETGKFDPSFSKGGRKEMIFDFFLTFL